MAKNHKPKKKTDNIKSSEMFEDFQEDKIKVTERLSNYFSRLKMIFREIKRISPGFIIILILNACLQSAQIGLAVVIPKIFLDALTRNLAWNQAISLILIIALCEGLLKLAQNSLKKKIDLEQIRMQNEMQKSISAKVSRLPYQDLENPDILNLKDSASFALTNQALAISLIRQIQDILRYGLTIIMLITILAQLSIFLVLFLLFCFIVTAFLQNSLKAYETKFFLNIVGVNRKYGYFVSQTMRTETQQPARIYNLEPMLSTKVESLNREIADWMQEYFLHLGKIEGIQSVIADIQAVAAYGYSALRVLTSIAGPPIGIGSFSLYAGSAIQFSSAIRELFTAYRNMQQSLDYLEPYQKFMELPEIENSLIPQEKLASQKDNEIPSIVFDKVSFTYPNSQEQVLKEISFTINRGEKISIVGLNGAGKTTLIKLLCRFFKPDSGQIRINGKDIQSMEESSYLAKISAVFQDFRLLPFSIQSNIASLPNDLIDAQVQTKIDLIAKETGVSEIVDELPQGIKTLLNKSIHQNGTELSGGQNQKIAIARALYKQGSLVILDEPTSALDPLAEAEIYEHFDTLVKGQTAIYVSHRMSSSKFCDKVLVLEEGRITGFAPHDELIREENSLYTCLFKEQAKYYQVDN